MGLTPRSRTLGRADYRLKGDRPMMGMRWTNWVGLLMFAILLLIHEPIWLYIFSDPAQDYSVNIVWAIPVAIYVIVAAALLIRGGPVRDKT
jgi:glucan phosphoethanolaminetransferase (alkaline phosphatase superfamily)